MNSSGLPGVGSDIGTQAVVKQISRDASAPLYGVRGQVPCRTVAYKGYVKMAKKQFGSQKKPDNKIPHTFIEK